jgi:hypothetical protein
LKGSPEGEIAEGERSKNRLGERALAELVRFFEN